MTDEDIAHIEIGEQARTFLEGDLGRILIGLAGQEIMLAEESLGTVDPEDPKAIRALQNRIACGKWFQEWLAELIDKGDTALEIFRQEKSNG